MNIVYITHLKKVKTHGPYYSVPAQITAQNKYDNVFWYNISEAEQDQWIETGLFHGVKEFPSCRIANLPDPFNQPDLVIFEEFYIKEYLKIASELRKRKIPYIIVPRGSFTDGAQKKKPVKKYIGNLLFFRNFARKAKAIQYLTTDERGSSGKIWNGNYIIIPNGTSTKEKAKDYSYGLKGCYIGRMDPYHKGIDLMIDLCSELQQEMRNQECSIHLYGPERFGCKAQIEKTIYERKIDDLMVLHDGVFDKEKEKVLLNSDFFIMTSRFEGHPMGLIEALSYGLPCFVTKGTNMTDEIKKYDAGWISDNSLEGMTDAMRKLLQEKDLFVKKGVNAHSLARNYDWDSLAQRSHDEYVRLIHT